MPKIGPNKVSIDPKAYAARVTSAKKRVAQMDPATKAKLSEYYPKITEKDIAKQMLNPKTTLSDMAKRIKANPTATPKAKVIKKAAAKPVVKLTTKVYGEAVKKAFNANQAASKKKPSTSKPTPAKMPATKTPVKKKVLVMPDKISPSKMTPAQKARYLKNPERYDG